MDVPDIGRVNYIRNAVKATVDAYDGETHLYIFAPDDPIIARLPAVCSPTCSSRRRQMPADLRAHARYPETLFRVQAEIYRTYHMLDPHRSTTRKICGTWRGTRRRRAAAPSR